jgi:CMP-N,N'-diacetyllegionaminic acid synthase
MKKFIFLYKRYFMTDYRVLIMARGGSKRVPGKNLRILGGGTLLARAIAKAQDVFPGEVYVSSDDPAILIEAGACGATPVRRPPQLAADCSTSEAGAIHFLALHPCNKLVLVQCTSPFLNPDDIRAGVELFEGSELDSVISVTKATGFYWTHEGRPLNFDPYERKRTQDMDMLFRENGGFYITFSEHILNGRRFAHGAIGFIIIPEARSVDIDTLEDLDYANLVESVSHKKS